MADQVPRLQAQLEEFNAEIQHLSKELQQLIDGRQKMIEQQNENELVQVELNHLEPEAKVYKLIGSVLVAQTLKESKENVEKRLQFIRREVGNVDAQVNANQSKQQSKRQQMQSLQEHLYKIIQAVQGQQK